MSSGVDADGDHSSMAAKAVAIHNQVNADTNVDAEAHIPSRTLNANDTNVNAAAPASGSSCGNR